MTTYPNENISGIVGATKRDIINYTPIKHYYTSAGAATNGIVWSPAAGKKFAITDIVVSVSAATTVTFEEDKVGGHDPILKVDLATNGGFVCNFQTPLTADELVADLLVTTTAGNLYVCVTGYELPA